MDENSSQQNNTNKNNENKDTNKTASETNSPENEMPETTRTLINAGSVPISNPGQPTDEKKLKRQIKEIQSYLPLKEQQAHFLLSQNGQTQTLNKIKEKATVYIKACKDCIYCIDATCARVLIEECEGCTITLDGKVMSNVVETWKCTDLNLNINTVVSTLQLDLCKNLNIQFKRKEDFYSVIWAGIYGMKISFLNAMEHSMTTGFDQMKALYPDINDRTSQFITHWNEGKLQTEQLLRFEDGYPVNTSDKDIHDRNKQRQEVKK